MSGNVYFMRQIDFYIWSYNKYGIFVSNMDREHWLCLYRLFCIKKGIPNKSVEERNN